MFTPVSHFQRLSDSRASVGLTKWVLVTGGPVSSLGRASRRYE